jgi:hypothetical protein
MDIKRVYQDITKSIVMAETDWCNGWLKCPDNSCENCPNYCQCQDFALFVFALKGDNDVKVS